MAEETSKSSLERIVEVFISHGVEFLVIGGQAETLYGSARVTYDTDLCYRRTAENLERLANALAELKPQLRGAPPDLPFRLDAKSLALGCNFTFLTEVGALDILGYVEPLGGYDDIITRTEPADLGRFSLRVIALDDLIRVKEHIQRPKDRDSLMHLLAIRRVREENRR
jgi:predicted nucleotidyltransferase